MAKIYDIDDEEIQKEYMIAFNRVVYLYDELKEDYERQGFSDNSEELLTSYKNAFRSYWTINITEPRRCKRLDE